MHQVKNVQDPKKRAQFHFYVHNLTLMAKIEDMSTQNYNRLRASRKGEKINWALIYAKNLRTWVAATRAKGASTILHAHLMVLA